MNLAHNKLLRELIDKRMGEVFGKPARNNPINGNRNAFVKDAAERGMPISTSRLAKYLHGTPGGLTEEQILWTATRLGIFIHINLGTPVFADGVLKYEILPYEESVAIKELNRIFK